MYTFTHVNMCKFMCVRVSKSASECVCTRVCMCKSGGGVCAHVWEAYVSVCVCMGVCIISPDGGPLRGEGSYFLSLSLPN